MKTVTRNEVDIGEIFRFAKNNFNLEWNRCCYIFQGLNEILPFKGHAEFYLGDLEDDLDYAIKVDEESDIKLAYTILIAFMKHHKVDEMYYIGDGN